MKALALILMAATLAQVFALVIKSNREINQQINNG